MIYAKALRIDQGITITDAAARSGLATRTIKKLEAGEEVGAPQLKSLADVYGVEHPHTLLLDTTSLGVA